MEARLPLPSALFVRMHVFRISVAVPLGGLILVAICSPRKSHHELMILMLLRKHKWGIKTSWRAWGDSVNLAPSRTEGAGEVNSPGPLPAKMQKMRQKKKKEKEGNSAPQDQESKHVLFLVLGWHGLLCEDSENLRLFYRLPPTIFFPQSGFSIPGSCPPFLYGKHTSPPAGSCIIVQNRILQSSSDPEIWGRN